jgi:hypothetical protein
MNSEENSALAGGAPLTATDCRQLALLRQIGRKRGR